ncbi:MAG TPA: CHASE3 domain-containing protein, partial [Acidimicrobiia bacterium]
MTGGINRRTVVASGGLAAVVSVAFAVVLLQISQMHHAEGLARHSEQVIAAANQLERLVIDLETGLRGFALTGDERFLAPLTEARRAFPEQARALERLAGGTPASQIEQAGNAYIREYVSPTIDAVRRDLTALPIESGLLAPSPQTTAVFQEGRRRVDELRARFDRFARAEGDRAAAR